MCTHIISYGTFHTKITKCWHCQWLLAPPFPNILGMNLCMTVVVCILLLWITVHGLFQGYRECSNNCSLRSVYTRSLQHWCICPKVKLSAMALRAHFSWRWLRVIEWSDLLSHADVGDCASHTHTHTLRNKIHTNMLCM